jgi:sulfate transport system ATP-binding protein
VELGPLTLDMPEHAKSKNQEIVSLIRPHDIEISIREEGKEFITAEILFIRAVGPIVNLELKRLDNGDYIEAEISKEIYKKLALKEKQQVYLKPRDFRVFTPEDYVI